MAIDGEVVTTPYPNWVMAIAIAMITAGVLPIPAVFLLRRMQCLKLDVDIHQGSIRRIETTVSTKEMMDDQDVMSPDYSPGAPLESTTTRFTIGDFDDDDEDDGDGASPRDRLADFDVSSSDEEGSLRPPRPRATPKKAFQMEILNDY